MKLESKYFDSIRLGARRASATSEEHEHPRCQWKGCAAAGHHRAPKGRGRDGEYFLFCVDHARKYNESYNYFDGMSDAEVEEFQKDAITGHRPTWKVGANAWAHGTRANVAGGQSKWSATGKAADPHGFFAWRAKQQREEPIEQRRQLRPLERKALETFDLPHSAGKDEIKSRYKQLVKLHHPDANGGDARSAEKLREVIQAYNYLRQAGLV